MVWWILGFFVIGTLLAIPFAMAAAKQPPPPCEDEWISIKLDNVDANEKADPVQESSEKTVVF